MNILTHVSLFTGIAGIDLAAEWAGFRTVCFVEIDPYCQRVLKKHWPNVPIIGDIRDVTKETIANARQLYRPSESSDGQRGDREESTCLETSKGNSLERRSSNTINPITLISGGFPCQPVSHAGKRRGKEDDRWLWPEMLRVISEIRPTWVVAENVTGLLTMGFYDCLSDLDSQGYETISFVIPACGANAPHRRNRIFIVAHYEGGGLGQELNSFTDKLLSKDRTPQELESSGGDAADSKGKGLEGAISIRGEEYWAVEPDVGRVAYGISNRVDRLKALGNAVVPQQIYPILKAIADIEKG